MIPGKYTKLGFDIVSFGAKSKTLRFEGKPIFVFNADSNLETDFINHICETYMHICDKRKSPVCLKTG